MNPIYRKFPVIAALFCFILFASFGQVFTDPLGADSLAAPYRTGKIDPRIAEIPSELQERVFTDPRGYLPRLTKFLVDGGENDYHKVKILHDWIALNISYDTDKFWGLSDEGTSKVYSLLPLKRTTCGGFSALFKEMAEMAGFEVIIISGLSRYYRRADGSPAGHAWNGVKIGGKWYIVDTTHDNRSGYKHGVYSEKGKYRDTNLFLKPEIKLHTNLPHNADYQFVDTPMTEEEFFSPPRIPRGYFRFGVEFSGKDFLKKIYTATEAKEGNNIFSCFDAVDSRKGVFRVELKTPENVRFYAHLKDADGNKYPLNAHYYKEGNKSVFLFTAPGKGTFKAGISGRFTDREDSWWSVYSFKIKEEAGSGPTLPLDGLVYKQQPFDRFNLTMIKSDTAGKSPEGYYTLEIEHPDGVSVTSSLRSHKDEYLKGRTTTSVIGNRRTYYYSPPGRGIFLVKLYAKPEGEKNSQTALVFKVDNRRGGDLPLPPAERMIAYRQFSEDGFRLLEENVTAGGEGGIYRVKVRSTNDWLMTCALKDEDGKSFNDHFVYDRKGNDYTFYFSSPGKGEYTARIYQKDKEGSSKTALYFKLRDEKKGPMVPLENLVYEANGQREFNVKFDFQQVDKDKMRYYRIELEQPDHLEFWGTVRDSQGKNLKNVVKAGYPPGKRVYLFALPPGEKGLGQIYVKNKGAKNYQHKVIQFQVNTPRSKRITALPPSGEMIYYTNFSENGFRLLEENITTGGDDGIYKVKVRATDQWLMDCAIQDKDSKSVYYHSVFDRKGNDYTFYFSSPGRGDFTARIYQKEKAGAYKTALYFMIRNEKKGPMVPLENAVYEASGRKEFKVKFDFQQVDRDKKRYYRVELEHPEHLEFWGTIRDSQGKNLKNVVKASYPPGKRVYYFALPPGEKGLAQIYVKPRGAEKYNHKVIQFQAETPRTNKSFALPPQGELYYYKTFGQLGFVHLKDNLGEEPEAGIYQVKIRSPEDYSMKCNFYDSEMKKVPGYYTYHKDGNDYNFYFSPPRKGFYTARIYRSTEEKKWSTVCSFDLDYKGPPGQQVPRLSRMMRKNGYDPLDLKLLSQNIHRPKGPYTLEIQCPPNVELLCNLKDTSGKLQKGNYKSTRNGNIYTLTLTSPDSDIYTARVYGRFKGEKSFSYEAVEFNIRG